MSADRPLTPKQSAFVREFRVDRNRTQAAIRAGYSAHTAEQAGSRLLRDVHVAAAIAKNEEVIAKKIDVTVDRLVMEMAYSAFFDPGEMSKYKLDGPDDIAKLPDHVRRAIAGWSWDRRGNFVVKIIDKPRNIEMLGRHAGMFKDNLDIKVGLEAFVLHSFTSTDDKSAQ